MKAMKAPHVTRPIGALAARRVVPGMQRGATLFTALMILILLTLLALSVAQVTGLQERMAGLYRADQQAFQDAEDQLVATENSILEDPVQCDQRYRIAFPAEWSDGSITEGVQIENLNQAGGGSSGPRVNPLAGSAQAGLDNTPGGPNCLVFRLSSRQGDRGADSTALALVQSIYVP